MLWRRKKPEKKTLAPLVGLEGIEEKEEGVELRYISGRVFIQAVLPEIVRLRISKSEFLPKPISDAVVWKKASSYKLNRELNRLVFLTDKLKVVIPEGEFRFEIFDENERLINRDFPGAGVRFDQDSFQVHRYIFPDERFYGLGDKYGELVRSAKSWIFWNVDVGWKKFKKDPRYTSIPFLISVRRDIYCGWFIDHSGWLKIDVGSKFSRLLSIYGAGKEIDIYFLYCRDLKTLVKNFTLLVGRSFLPPLWSLGYHQSRYSYFSQKEIEELVQEFEKRDIPLSAVYLDIHYMDKFKVFTVDKKRFPDLKGLAENLMKKGIRLVGIIDPGLYADESYKPYLRAKIEDVLCKTEQGEEYQARLWPGKCAFVDFFQEKAREFWAEEHKSLFETGISGIWNDMNEPSFWKMDLRKGELVIPLFGERHPKIVHQIGEFIVPHRHCRNLYGQKETVATIEAFKKFMPGKRWFVLSRSGFAGIQRYACIWTGDNISRFEYLASSISQILSLGLCGVSFVGADIGGFALDCSDELFARWIELGAFYPFCRNHSAITTRAQEPYRFGKDVEEIARKYIKLRYRFLPTLYSLFWQSHTEGLSIWRPLFMEFPKDSCIWNIEDQFMIGEFMMIAPVVEQGANKRKVYFPQGKWFDYWSEEIFCGPDEVEIDAELDHLPIFIREGGILIFQPQPKMKIPWEAIELDLYEGNGKTKFFLFEDDGESFDYLKGKYSLREIILNCLEEKISLTISPKKGKLNIEKRSWILRFHLTRSPVRIFYQKNLLPKEKIKSLSDKIVEVEIFPDDNEQKIELEF